MGDTMSKKVAVLGGGSAGYVAAIRCAQLGAQVTLFEKERLGGVCVNRGCIPTKALLESARVLSDATDAKLFGVSTSGVSIDLEAVTKRTTAIVDQLVGGISTLLRRNRIEVVADTGVLQGAGTVLSKASGTRFSSDVTIVATGSRPAMAHIEGLEDCAVMTSDDMLHLSTVPESLVIIGGGAIGLEFAQIAARLGGKVTVLEVLPHLLGNMDSEITEALRTALESSGIRIHTSSRVLRLMKKDSHKIVVFEHEHGISELEAAEVMMAVGRQPNIEGFGLETIPVSFDKKTRCIVTDNRTRTGVGGVYAVGDVAGSPMLAHWAMAQGRCAAENIMGVGGELNSAACPMCVYTIPEVASVGMSEEIAKQQYGEIKVGRFPFAANGRALILGDTTGMTKVVADAKHGQVLGIHIIGLHASELVSEAVSLVQMEATIEELINSIHPHPTLSETLLEAGFRAAGRPIHV
jgi:dihydrolipoamide dehydrogenase